MGKYLVVSGHGNRYIMVLYRKVRNLILIESMKTRASGKMCQAYNELMTCLTKRGIKAAKGMLDDEASDKFLQAIKQKGIIYEKVPPNMH